MHKSLNLVALFLGFAGACCAYADSWRTASRFSVDGISLGYGPELMTWWWRNCGQIGFILIAFAFAFAIEIIVFVLSGLLKDHPKIQRTDIEDSSEGVKCNGDKSI